MEISAGDLIALGRIVALEMAVRLLIERSPEPEQIRDQLASGARALADTIIKDSQLSQGVFGHGIVIGAMEITGREDI